MKYLNHFLIYFVLAITSYSCASLNKDQDVDLKEFKPSQEFGVFSAEKKAELEKRFAQKASEALAASETGDSNETVFNFGSETSVKSVTPAKLNAGPRQASVLPDKTCSEILKEVEVYASSTNKSFIVKNVNVGFVFLSKQLNDQDFIFVAPSTNFMLAPKKTEDSVRLKCVEDGEYFDLISNLKIFTAK